jgi:hypothetical protein
LNYITNQQKFLIRLFQRLKLKLNPACKFAGGIRELHAAPIMLAIYPLRELNFKFK